MVRDQGIGATPFGKSVHSSEAPSPMRPRDAAAHYILNIDNQQLRETNHNNAGKQAVPPDVQSNTATIQKFLSDPQPGTAAATARTNQ